MSIDDPSSPSFLGVFLSWLPLLLLIGVLVYSARMIRQAAPAPDYWHEHLNIERESLEARKETNRILSKLAERLDK